MEVVRGRLQPGERVAADEVEPSLMRIVLPVRMQLRGGRTRLTAPSGAVPAAKSRIDESLVRALKSAHRLAAEHGLKQTGGDLRDASAPATKYNRRLCSLAFLAPDIQRAILEGLQPAALKLTSLMVNELPLAWVEQRRVFGFS